MENCMQCEEILQIEKKEARKIDFLQTLVRLFNEHPIAGSEWMSMMK